MAVTPCSHCNRTDSVKLRRQITASGITQYLWYCLRCSRPAHKDKLFVKHETVEGWVAAGRLPSTDSLPLIRDYRTGITCDVCKGSGAEFHHWLPQAFNDIIPNHSSWPGAYLCKKCHDLWHEVVTPYLPGRGNTDYARHTKTKYLNKE